MDNVFVSGLRMSGTVLQVQASILDQLAKDSGVDMVELAIKTAAAATRNLGKALEELANELDDKTDKSDSKTTDS